MSEPTLDLEPIDPADLEPVDGSQDPDATEGDDA